MKNPNDFIPGVTDAGPPRAAKGGFPYTGHATLAAQADEDGGSHRRQMTAGSNRLRETILTVRHCSNIGRAHHA